MIGKCEFKRKGDIRTVDTRKRYKVICPHCGKVQYCCKSILHEMGVENGGYGRCLECGNHMRLIFEGKKKKNEGGKMEGSG